MGTPYGSYAEYGLAPVHTTMKIPEWMAFEDAATVPLVAFTAAVTLFRRLRVTTAPWDVSGPVSASSISPFIAGPKTTNSNNEKKRPLLVYGASSALGCYVIQLAKATAGVGPIIAVAGGSSAHVAGFLDLNGEGGDTLLDYRVGTGEWDAAARKAMAGLELKHAVDCVSSGQTWVPLVELVGKGGVVSVVSGSRKYDEPEVEKSGAKIVYTYVGTVHDGKYKPGMPCQPSKEEAEGDVAFAEKFAVSGMFCPCALD